MFKWAEYVCARTETREGWPEDRVYWCMFALEGEPDADWERAVKAKGGGEESGKPCPRLMSVEGEEEEEVVVMVVVRSAK